MGLLPLPPGARIGVFSPSGVPDPEGLRAGLAVLERWGFCPVPGPGVARRERYLAGTDEERLADLEWALSDPSLDAAWMSRGGYGLSRLLPHVRWERVVPRPVLGFSDGTALLQALQCRGIPGGIHAPVVHSLATHPDAETLLALRRLLADADGTGAEWDGEVLVPGAAEGPLVGGNLTVLASLAGTPEALRAGGSILLLEDVGERPYRIDRLLVQLRRSGALDGVLGIALGEFVSCDDRPDRDGTARAALAAGLGDLGVPVLAGLPVGHGPRNRPFVHGAPAAIRDGRLGLPGRAPGGPPRRAPAAAPSTRANRTG